MWTLLFRIGPYLPEFLWQRIRRLVWHSYWQQEGRQESSRADGSNHPETSSLETIEGSERATLIEAICDHYPFESLLEIGCGYGQNFHILADFFPDVRLIGIDIDQARVRAGNDLLRDADFGNRVELRHQSADQLGNFADKSFDLVIASAALLYVGADRIESVAREMLRVCRRVVLLLEQHEVRDAFSEQHLGRFVAPDGTTPGYWLRDYEKLFRTLGCKGVRVSKVPAPRWKSENWDLYASFVEVRP